LTLTLSQRVARQDLLGQQFAGHAADVGGRREPRCAGLDVGLDREAPADVVDVAGVACLWRAAAAGFQQAAADSVMRGENKSVPIFFIALFKIPEPPLTQLR
jgi:hypothetical protein